MAETTDYLTRLGKALVAGDQRVNPFRLVRKSHLDEICRRWWNKVEALNDATDAESQSTSRRRTVTNLLVQSLQVIVPNVVGEVKPWFTPTRVGLQGESELLMTMIEQWQYELQMQQVWEAWALDATLAPFGIIEINIRAGNEILARDGQRYDVGQPFAANVDLDDYAMDADARCHAEKRWDSNRIRIVREAALESGLYDEEAIMNAPSLRDLQRDGTADRTAPGADQHVLEDTIELWKVNCYGPSETTIHTLVADATGSSGSLLGDAPRSVREAYTFEGPEGGPLSILELGLPVRNQPFPLPPVAAWRDLHDAMAKISQRMVSQLLRTKRVLAYKKGKKDEHLALKRARDGDSLAVGDTKDHSIIDMGGISSELLQGVEWLLSSYNDASGSFQMRSGAKSPAKTATGASILQANSEQITSRLAKNFKRGAGDAYRQVAWWFITDPGIAKPVPYRLPGGETIELTYSQETREGDFEDFSFEMAAVNGTQLDPAVRAARTIEFMDKMPQLVMTFTQMGIPPMPALKALARDMGITNLAEIIPGSELQVPLPQLQPPTGAQQVGNPPNPGSSGGQGPSPGGARINQVRSARTRGARPAPAGV